MTLSALIQMATMIKNQYGDIPVICADGSSAQRIGIKPPVFGNITNYMPIGNCTNVAVINGGNLTNYTYNNINCNEIVGGGGGNF